MTEENGTEECAVSPEMKKLREKITHQLNELDARGRRPAMGPLRVEALIDFLLPKHTPQRDEFERQFMLDLSEDLEKRLSEARRAALLDGAPAMGSVAAALGRRG